MYFSKFARQSEFFRSPCIRNKRDSPGITAPDRASNGSTTDSGSACADFVCA